MVRACQQLLPISRQSKPVVSLSGRSAATRAEPVRWGSALASVTPSWQQVSDSSKRGRRTVVYLNGQAAPGSTGRAEGRLAAVLAAEPASQAAQDDGQNVIRHAVDLFGACMLIVALLAVAMFV
ncbi:MAG: hypothetical protein R3F29_04920 [Planctomycetota bacterium]